MKQMKWNNSIKMVISIIGMTICLLSGCVKENHMDDREPEQEQTDNREDAGLEELEAWRVEEQREYKRKVRCRNSRK